MDCWVIVPTHLVWEGQIRRVKDARISTKVTKQAGRFFNSEPGVGMFPERSV
jgi:hypothetical protein